MKGFLNKTGIFLLLSLVLFHIEPFYLYFTKKYQQLLTGREVYLSILKSKEKSVAKKLVIGDSVGYQLFSPLFSSDSLNSLCCNQAISLAGQFILLKNYLNAGNRIDTLYMVFNPFSFRNNLDQGYTYQYFLKPFFNHEYRHRLSPLVFRQIEKIPFYYLAQYPTVLTTNWVPDYNPPDNEFTFMAPISDYYLNEIKKLSITENFGIRMISPPVNKLYRKEIVAMKKMECAGSSMKKEINQYFETIVFLEDSAFHDGSHLKNPLPFAEQYRKKYLFPKPCQTNLTN